MVFAFLILIFGLGKMTEKEIIDKAKRKIPKWFNSPNQISSQIVINFMGLLNDNSSVNFDDLEDKCRNIKTFKDNFTQLSGKAEKNHAKIFERNDSIVTLWKPIEEFLIKEYERYKSTNYKPVIIANISYNPTGWRNLYLNPKASHSYVTENPGYESLNFNFDKEGADTFNDIYGFVQWTSDPIKFIKGGAVIFYSRNTDTNKGQVVGIYCNVEILHDRKYIDWNGFENNKVGFNLKANKELSMLFPIPLDDDNYKESKGTRLVGQVGYSYYENEIAETVIKDELYELSKSGVQKNEFDKLKNIYSFLTGKPFDEDIIQQDELVELLTSNKNHIISDLESLTPSEPETVTIKQKAYKRDNKTIAQIKVLRNFECQICGTKIRKEKGGFYIEAAHIKPKNKKGRETPENILILCPNHHKEFDYGARKILNHNKDSIKFEMNGVPYKLNLKIE
jgi:putative restriction endonuclease